jgi:hypothetical protein
MKKKKNLRRLSKILLTCILIFSWLFTDWLRILNFPPKIPEVQAAIAKVGTDTSGTSTSGSSTTLSFSHTLVSGSNRMVAVSVGVENNGNTDVTSVTYGGEAMTKAIDQATGSSGYIYISEIWYILENDLPDDGSNTVLITISSATNAEINGFAAEYTGISQGAPEATDGSFQTSGATISNTISPSTDAWVLSAVGSGGTNYSSTVLSFNPTHRWILSGDENDSVGTANSDGGNDPTWVTSVIPNGGVSQSGDYNGTDDETLIPNQSDINSSTTTQKSISVWVEVDTIDTSNGGRVIWGEGGSSNGLTLYVYDESGTDTLWFDIYEGSAHDTLSWTGIQTGTLYHIGAVMDATNGNMYLYINGSLVDSKTGGLAISTTFSSHSAGAALGGVDSTLDDRSGGSMTGVFDGRIADLAYYGEVTPLTQGNFQSIYAAGLGSNGTFSHGQSQVEVLDYDDTSTGFAVAELRGASGETSLDSTYSGTIYRLARVAASWTASGAAEPTFTLNDYRWYVDNDSENVAAIWGTPDIAESTSIVPLPAGNDPPDSSQELRLRVNFTVNTASLTATSQQFKLQFKAGTDGSCTTGSWTDVGSGAWVFATSSVTDGANLSVIKLSSSDVLEEYAKSNPTQTNHNSATATQDIEYDFHIIGTSMAEATQYSFRVVESDNTVFDAYTNCPTLTTEPGTSLLMRHGDFFSEGLEKGFFWTD